MNRHGWMLVAAWLVPGFAFAQVGAQPPTVSVEEVEAAEVTAGPAEEEVVTRVPGLGGNVAAPMEKRSEERAEVADEGAVTERDMADGMRPGTLRAEAEGRQERGADRARIVQARPASERTGVSPPPPVIRSENGQAVVFNIAVAHLNRIVTPFEKPAVKTTSTASIATDKGILYVSTSLDEPVAMFVHDADDPSQALSLTMVPAEIPPVSTTVELVGYSPKKSVLTDRSPEDARSYELAHPYPQMVTALMRDLALGKIPDGYGFEELNGPHPAMPVCGFGPGVWVEERQMAIGSSLIVFVAKVTNRAGMAVELHEEACAQEQVRAVASWPKRSLLPGESTELFVAIDAGYAEDDGLRRPSVIGGSR